MSGSCSGAVPLLDPRKCYPTASQPGPRWRLGSHVGQAGWASLPPANPVKDNNELREAKDFAHPHNPRAAAALAALAAQVKPGQLLGRQLYRAGGQIGAKLFAS